MKKFQNLLFSSVPMLISLAIQIVVVFYVLFIAIAFLFGYAPLVTGVSYDYSDLMELAADTEFNTLVMVIFSVSCSITFGIWYKKRCGGTFKINVKKDFHPLELLGIAFLIPGAQYLSSIVTALVSTAFPSWLADYEEMMETAGLSEDISVLMMLYSVILAPISEELIFRGVTLRIAQRTFPFWIANIIQAFFFGVFHMNMLQGCYTFVLGLILGYICYKGGSIYHVIFFHFLFNLWGTTAAEWLVVENETLYGLIVIFGCIIGLTLGFSLFHIGNKKKK